MARSRLLDTLIAGLMVALVAVVFAQVLLRYLTYQPVAWTEELARFAFIWLCLVGAAEGARRGAHFAVDLVPRLVPGAAGRWFRAALRLVEACAYAILAWAGIRILGVVHAQRSITLDMPISFAYAAIPTAAMLMCAFTLLAARRELARPSTE
jgi:TRAP-type C4-dicarboxylate transport system permease small subunit